MSAVVANVLNPDKGAFAQVGFYAGMVYNPMSGMQVPGVNWKFLNLKSRFELTGTMQNNNMVIDSGGSLGTVEGFFMQIQAEAEFTIHFNPEFGLGSRTCKVINVFGSNILPRTLAGIPNMPKRMVLAV